MIEKLGHLPLGLLILASFVAYGFALWFPFRHDKVGFLPGFAGAMFGNLITWILHVTLGNPILTFAFPFALAGISFILFRRRTESQPEQSLPPYPQPEPKRGLGSGEG